MAIARFQMPDGRVARFEVPDGTTPEQAQSLMEAHFAGGKPGDAPAAPKQEANPRGLANATLGDIATEFGREARDSLPGKFIRGIPDALAGGVRGAADIGHTILEGADKASQWLTPTGAAMRKAGIQNPLTAPDRREASTAALEDMGADPESLAFQGGRLGANVAGTAGVGGVLAAPVRAVSPALSSALASGGMTTGATRAPGVVPWLQDMATRMAGGAGTGYAAASMIDPEAGGTGATVGALLPPGLKAAGAAGGLLGGLFRKAAPVVSQSAAARAAAEKAAAAIGPDDLTQAVGDIQTYYPRGAERIPVTSAGVTGNPGLARLEQGSRLRTPEPWMDFDRTQGKAVFDNVLDATSEATEIAARKAVRRENWDAAWDAASQSYKPRNWNRLMGEMGPKLEQAMASPEASNPAVRNVLSAIREEVIRVGPDFSPAHLQQIRANLSGRANFLSPDAFKSAPRDSPAVVSVIREIDGMLNKATGGKWQKVVEGYAKDSEKVRSAAAASKVRGSFIDPETGRIIAKTSDVAGEVPVITDAGLTRSMNAARLPDKSLALSQAAEQRLSATIDALRRQNVMQNLKRSTSGGGGADTAGNFMALGARAGGTPNIVLQALEAIGKVGTGKTDAALQELLSNPTALARALDELRAAQGQAGQLSGLLGPATYRTAPVLSAQ